MIRCHFSIGHTTSCFIYVKNSCLIDTDFLTYHLTISASRLSSQSVNKQTSLLSRQPDFIRLCDDVCFEYAYHHHVYIFLDLVLFKNRHSWNRSSCLGRGASTCRKGKRKFKNNFNFTWEWLHYVTLKAHLLSGFLSVTKSNWERT